MLDSYPEWLTADLEAKQSLDPAEGANRFDADYMERISVKFDKSNILRGFINVLNDEEECRVGQGNRKKRSENAA